MSNRIESALGFLLDEARASARYAEFYTKRIALWIAISMPVSAAAEAWISPSSPSTFPMRILCALLCVVAVLFPNFWQQHRTYAAVYRVFLIGFVGIFTFSVFLIHNSAIADTYPTAPTLWVLQYIVALFLVMQMLSSPALLAFTWVTATLSSLIVLFWIPNPDWRSITNYALYPTPVIITALLLGAITNRHTKIVAIEKLQTAYSIGSNIAHELRTPLASIGGFSNGIEMRLRQLSSDYEKAISEGAGMPESSRQQLESIRSAVNDIRKEVTYSNTIIDMLLAATASRPMGVGGFENCSAAACIEEAIARFPYNNDVERNLPKAIIDQDFEINAQQTLIVHVLFNLLKNGIRYAGDSAKGSLLVRCFSEDSTNIVSVRDSGPGIPKHARRQIFERFYTTQGFGQGTGIGLSFCKATMEALDGSIECLSDGESFTEFRLRFPQLEEGQQPARQLQNA